METLEVAHEADRFHARVAHLAAGEVEPDDALGDGLEHLELVISEVLRGVDHVDAKPFILGRDRHHGEMVFFRRLVHLSHARSLFFLRKRIPDRRSDGKFGAFRGLLTGVDGRHLGGDGGDSRVISELGHGRVGLRSRVDPELQQFHLGGLERITLRRHELVVVVRQKHTDNHLRFIRLARHHRGKVRAFSTREKQFVGVHAELALDLVFVVTLVAGLVEHGDDEVLVNQTLPDRLFNRRRRDSASIGRGRLLGRSAKTDEQGGFQSGRGVLGEVVGLVDHRAPKVTARSRRKSRRRRSEAGEKTFPLHRKDEGEERQNHHGEAEIKVKVHGPARVILERHEEVADHRRSDPTEETEPKDERNRGSEMREGGEVSEKLHRDRKKDETDRKVHDEHVESGDEMKKPSLLGPAAINEPDPGQNGRPYDSQQKRELRRSPDGGLMLHKTTHGKASCEGRGRSNARWRAKRHRKEPSRGLHLRLVRRHTVARAPRHNPARKLIWQSEIIRFN